VRVPIEPQESRWAFPPLEGSEPDGPVAVGGDLEPGTILNAYRAGLFPMPVGRRHLIGWWSPDPRAVLPVKSLRVSRSMRRSARRYEVTVDRCFTEVVRHCADPARTHGWITSDIEHAYARLHELGWAHSVETWQDGELVGGLYGVSIGAFFAGESMFHHATDASKVALMHLVEAMRDVEGALLDVQWQTAHLSSLGVVEVSRDRYLRALDVAVHATPLDLRIACP
jgi:leucyl/phenylalanyl-tRNA--protein transferase